MNFLYIHTHDTGRLLSPYGYRVPTPNIENFAGDAAVFEQCYCAGPTCSPSRAAMLTGVYPHQNGMLGLAQRGFSIDYSRHLVQWLNRHGYHTVLCGIQHEAGWYMNKEDADPIGYCENLTHSDEGYRQEELVKWDMENARSAADWIRQYDGSKPFFLSYGMFATHRRFPDWVDESVNQNFMQPPVPLPNTPEVRLDMAQFATSVKWADDCFGVVINALKEKGIYDDTVIMLTTDHGLSAPYCKCSLFDSGIGVAMILRKPGAASNGKAVNGMISHVDVYPTVCELLGIDTPDWLEGTSFAPMLEDSSRTIRDEIYSEVTFHTSYEPARCVRTGRYKYIRYFDTDWLNTNCSNCDESLTKDYYLTKGLRERPKAAEALYDMVYDTGERNNLIDDPACREIADTLRRKLQEHMERTNDPLLAGPIEVRPEWKVNRKECMQASSKNPDDYVSLGRKKS